MAVFKLKREYTFSDSQVVSVLNRLKIRGRVRRQWIKRLKTIDIGACVYEAIDQLQNHLWIEIDELERTLLKAFVSRYRLTYIMTHYEVDDDIQGFLTGAFLKELSDYMACLSSKQTLYRYIWTKQSIQFKKGYRPKAHDGEVCYWFLKDYKALTLAFDGVKQYKLLVFQLLYQAGLKGNFEEILSSGFLKINLFENHFSTYENLKGEGRIVNKTWAYSLLAKLILKGEILNKEKIFTCLSTYAYVRTGKIDDSIKRLFYFEEKKKVHFEIYRPSKGDQFTKQCMATYFKKLGQQQLAELEGIKDETTYIFYHWMYRVNPWRFIMYRHLLSKLHIDLEDPCLKELNVFVFVMDKLCHWERILTRCLLNDFEIHMAMSNYEQMKVWESQLYLDEISTALTD